ncbi:MAG: hypothetical protein ACK55I_15795, partial [bacterium]
AGVDADRRENLRVFLEAFGLESFLREFAAGEVARLVVDLSDPALVFPRGCAEIKTAVVRQRVRGAGQFADGEGHTASAARAVPSA